MRRLGMHFVVCAAVLGIASTAMAQGQGQGRGGRGGRGGFGGFGGGGAFGVNLSRIVNIEEVQKELKITEEQKTKLAAIRDEARQGGGGGGGGGFGNFQNMSEEEREKFFADMRKRQEERDKKVEAVLDADQNKRAKEVMLQLKGNGALAEADVAKQLALTEDQVASIKTIGEESRKQIGELFQGGGGGGNREENQKKMAEIRKNTDEEYLNVLTDEQKAKFAAMKGVKADIDPSVLFRGFGGGGGGRGGQGGAGGGRRGGRGGNNTSA